MRSSRALSFQHEEVYSNVVSGIKVYNWLEDLPNERSGNETNSKFVYTVAIANVSYTCLLSIIKHSGYFNHILIIIVACMPVVCSYDISLRSASKYLLII